MSHWFGLLYIQQLFPSTLVIWRHKSIMSALKTYQWAPLCCCCNCKVDCTVIVKILNCPSYRVLDTRDVQVEGQRNNCSLLCSELATCQTRLSGYEMWHIVYCNRLDCHRHLFLICYLLSFVSVIFSSFWGRIIFQWWAQECSGRVSNSVPASYHYEVTVFEDWPLPYLNADVFACHVIKKKSESRAYSKSKPSKIELEASLAHQVSHHFSNKKTSVLGDDSDLLSLQREANCIKGKGYIWTLGRRGSPPHPQVLALSRCILLVLCSLCHFFSITQAHIQTH